MIDLSALAANATNASGGSQHKRLPPVHLWHPPFCGVIDMRIARDGTWFYQGTPIARPAMVKLFASILRKDPERFVLVTPVEMVEITVDDAPFVAVEMQVEDKNSQQTLAFRTNIDDWTTASQSHPIRFESEAAGGLKPYVLVRDKLWAKATRSVYFEMVNLATERMVNDEAVLGIESAGSFFKMAPLSDIGDFS